jgi:hypothetical protein
MTESSSAQATLDALTAFGPTNPRLVRFHDVGPAFPGLHVTGLDHYPDRALLLPGLAVIQRGGFAQHLAYLREVGIGADRFLAVSPGDTLTGSLGPDQLTQLRRLAGDGHQFEFFLTTEGDEAFVAREMQLPYEKVVWGPRAKLARNANDKIWLRRQFPNSVLKTARFPDHEILSVLQEELIYDFVRDNLEINGGAVLKHPSLASGDGIFVIRDGQSWREEVAAALGDFHQRSYTGEIIVEAFYESLPLSGQAEITTEGPRFICATVQEIANDTDHAGNYLTNGPLPGVTAGIAAQVETDTLELAFGLWRLGYRGYVGFDFLYDLRFGQLFVIECNARITGAMYPLSVGLQVQSKGQPSWAVATEIMQPTRQYDFNTLMRLLKVRDLLFDGTAGILPACPGLLRYGKAMLYAVGDTTPAAADYLDTARDLLG